MDLEKFIRIVPDFPIKGINFYDITTLFDNKITFNYIIQLLSKRYKSKGLDKIVAIEARGFILGSALAHSLDLGFVPIRKKVSYHIKQFQIHIVWNMAKIQLKFM